MRVIVGLGNPGEKYEKTRHNVGFILLNIFAKDLNAPWTFDKGFNADIAKLDDLILVKPQTYMNSSGSSIVKILNYFKISADNLVVIHDDVDLVFGDIKYKKGSGAAGHHGVEDTKEKLNTLDFWRVRVGIGRPQDNKFRVEDYVLTQFSNEEYLTLTKEIASKAKTILKI